MRRTFSLLLCRAAVVALVAVNIGRAVGSELDEGFHAPPMEARSRTWWHWQNGFLNADQMERELKFMREAGPGRTADGHTATSAAPCEWPVLKTYEGKYAARVKMPVGGVGTGTISVSGKGALVDWETRNKPEKGRIPRIWEWGSAFVIRAEKADGTKCARLLQGPLDEGLDYFAAPINHGMPRFEKSVFKTAFPFAQIEMEDSRMPFKVTMETYNPLIPGDSEASGIPAMFIRYRVKNLTDEPLDAAISAQILIPEDGGATNEWSCCAEKGRPGLLFRELRAANHPRLGELAVLADAANAKVSRATDFDKASWCVANTHIWNRFRDFGDIVPFVSDQPQGKYPFSVMAVAKPIPAHGEETFAFAIGWRYPNMLAWERRGDEPECGNHYARTLSAWTVFRAFERIE